MNTITPTILALSTYGYPIHNSCYNQDYLPAGIITCLSISSLLVQLSKKVDNSNSEVISLKHASKLRLVNGLLFLSLVGYNASQYYYKNSIPHLVIAFFSLASTYFNFTNLKRLAPSNFYIVHTIMNFLVSLPFYFI